MWRPPERGVGVPPARAPANGGREGVGLPQDIIVARTQLGGHGLLPRGRALPWPRGGAAEGGPVRLPGRPPPALGPVKVLRTHHLVSAIIDRIQTNAGLVEQHAAAPSRGRRGRRVDGAAGVGGHCVGKLLPALSERALSRRAARGSRNAMPLACVGGRATNNEHRALPASFRFRVTAECWRAVSPAMVVTRGPDTLHDTHLCAIICAKRESGQATAPHVGTPDRTYTKRTQHDDTIRTKAGARPSK